MPEKPTYEELEQRVSQLEKIVAQKSQDIEHHNRSQSLHQAILKASNAGFWMTDQKGRFLEFNDTYVNRSGYSRDELLKMQISDLEAEHNPEQIAAVINDVKQKGFFRFESKHRAKNGEIWPVEVYASYWRIDKGHFFVFIHDISERRKAEQAFANEQKRLAGIIKGTRSGTWEWNVQTDEVILNERWAEMLGYTLEELSPTSINTWMKRCHPDDLKISNELLTKHFRGELDYYECEVRVRHKDGSWVWILDRGSIVTWTKDGKPLMMMGTHQDISRRKQTEAALQQSEEKMRSIFLVAPVGIGLVKDRVLLDVNPAFCKMLGYTRDELLWKKATILYASREEFEYVGREKYRQIQETGRGQVETQFLRKDGALIDILLTSIPTDPTDLSKMVTFTAMDITEQKRAEKALRASEARYRQLLDVSPICIAVFQDSKVAYVNPAGVKLYKVASAEELIDRPISDIVHPDYLEATLSRLQRMHQGEIGLYPAQNCYVAQDGSVLHVEVMATPMIYQDKPATQVMIIDTSERVTAEAERKKLQAQLLQAQKMESVGRLAGGVAHDYNNMLNVILGYTEIALQQTDPNGQLHQDLQEVYQAAERSADITGQLLAFARKQTISPKSIDLNDAVEGMLKMLRRLIGEDIELSWQPCSSQTPVFMDPAQVNQILANLCVNARDAIEGVGKLSIETDSVYLDTKSFTQSYELTPGEYVLLTMRDNGCGMDEETLKHIFEPFFTTKGTGEGTGLGLATVYGIVKQNNGWIFVESKQGRGATFRIYLPRQRAELQATAVEHAEKIPASRGETILIVEDEVSFLRLAKKFLLQLNYTVLDAETPNRALELSKEYDDTIDLLLTDVIMPQMNGRELAQTLRTSHPQLKVLYMSGYTADVIAERGVIDDTVNFLQKPFSNEILARKLRKILDEIEK